MTCANFKHDLESVRACIRAGHLECVKCEIEYLDSRETFPSDGTKFYNERISYVCLAIFELKSDGNPEILKYLISCGLFDIYPIEEEQIVRAVFLYGNEISLDLLKKSGLTFGNIDPDYFGYSNFLNNPRMVDTLGSKGMSIYLIAHPEVVHTMLISILAIDFVLIRSVLYKYGVTKEVLLKFDIKGILEDYGMIDRFDELMAML